jgi:hypothetical protein
MIAATIIVDMSRYTLILLEPVSKFIFPVVHPVHAGPAPSGERIGTGTPTDSRHGADPALIPQSAHIPEMSDPVVREMF